MNTTENTNTNRLNINTPNSFFFFGFKGGYYNIQFFFGIFVCFLKLIVTSDARTLQYNHQVVGTFQTSSPTSLQRGN